MNQIIVECSRIQRAQFPCTIEGISYDSLTDFVHKITHRLSLPYSAQKSQNDKRKTIVYCCTFSSAGCESRLIFNHFTNFNSDDFYSFNVQESILQAHRNCCSDDTIKNIKFQAKLGVLPGRIRSNLNVECGSNIFYNIRRPVLHEQRIENLDQLIENLENGTDKLIKVSKPGGVLYSITIVDNEILNSNYSDDIVIVDDTSMTNMYGLPLETMVVVDQEEHTQLLAYSIIPNKSSQSFIEFFQDFIELGGTSFRIIIVDRLQAQINFI